MGAQFAVETQGLTRRFRDVVAVADLDLRVPAGTVYGFLGPNGAGKTTTIRLLMGLLRPTRGSILIFGQPFTGRERALLRAVGSLVEAPSLYPHLTGRENVELKRRILGLSPESVDDSLRAFDL